MTVCTRTGGLVAIALMGLTSCTVVSSPGAAPPPSSICSAAGLQTLVGRSRDVLAAKTFPAPMRVIGPDDVVTQDYNPNRLNVVIGPDGRITRVFCG